MCDEDLVGQGGSDLGERSERGLKSENAPELVEAITTAMREP